MPRVDAESRAADLLEPVRALLDDAVERLPAGPGVRVTVGSVEGFSRLDGADLVLSEGLLGPAPMHPEEDPELPLDRWRRALAAVLEAVAMRALAAEVGREPLEDWRWRGLAIDAAEDAAPGLGLAAPDLALAVRTGDLGAHPRAGVAVVARLRAQGADRGARLRLLEEGLSLDDWLDTARWVLDRAHGPAASLPVQVTRIAPVDVPVTLRPWSFRPLAIPAHPRGGVVEVHGEGRVADAWAPAGREHRTIAVAGAAGCRLLPAVGGPVGEWEVASAHAFGQVFGARGITFGIRPSGRLDLVFADAFVGPVAALEVAENVGSSGTATGTWAVAGDHALRFDRIAHQGLTMHRRDGGFALPDTGFGVVSWLSALQEGEWRWRIEEGRLHLDGRMLGGLVEVWLRPG